MDMYLEIIDNPIRETWSELLQRPAVKAEVLDSLVENVFKEVKNSGDSALRRYTQEFDKVDISRLQVSKAEVEEASEKVPTQLKNAISLAKNNIEKFHASQGVNPNKIETSPGVWCWQEKRPIEKIGLYIPGGTAPLFSTVLMLAVPAALAGCREIQLCTPPQKDGSIDPAILFAADLCGVSKIFKVGGIQAIAAFTYGTQSISRVYKVFGPGNQYVTAAKQFALKSGLAIDLPAGPSELLVLADQSANPAFVAADLLSQAEHGQDSQVILVSDSKTLLKAVRNSVLEQLDTLPRKEIAREALRHAKFIYMAQKQQALNLVNEYAPEHLIINTLNPQDYISEILNAGSVFLGGYSPESAGDYASGTNHTLPTSGYAKQYSGVNLDSFQKAITFQELSRDGLQEIGPAIERMAEAEGLIAHKRAVTIRINPNNTTDENI